MNSKKRVVIGLFFLVAASFFMGAIFEKSEAKLNIIKAGVDSKGHPVCVNKSQVYLFKKRPRAKQDRFLLPRCAKPRSIRDQILLGFGQSGHLLGRLA